jgi:hypothetical protein
MWHPGLIVANLMADPSLHSCSQTELSAIVTRVLLSDSSVRTRSDKEE